MPAKKGAKKTTTKSAKKTAKKSIRKAAKTSALKPAKPVLVKKAPQSMPYEQGKWAAVYAREPGERRYWLIKSEPDVFSYDDLVAAPHHTTGWDSVRNTGARNFLRDAMKRGDLAFYYHSNAEPSAIVGVCEVVREGYPDPTAFDKSHAYYDVESDPAAPMWFMVDVRAVEKLARPVTLPEIKATAELSEMALIKVGRLSVVPVTEREWHIVIAMSKRAG